ncbi:hypothetical protein WMY93_002148 [Mugilogobius chulae]|uniref:L1 transposable element RRM domain-containing protein n=1 Tax=Mugilogobius chulae TaxID=88201 RepID=A0AAW0PWB2_9GOBI
MADKLRRFKFDATERLASRPITRQLAAEEGESPGPDVMEDIKAEILVSLKDDISQIIREELKRALSDNLQELKSEIHAVRAEIASSAAAVGSRLDAIETDVVDVTNGLSTWSDEVTTLQSVVVELKGEVKVLREKCEDLEGRMRRGNIRIVGIDEQPNSSSPSEVSKIIRQVLKLDRDVKVDRSHRSLASKKTGDNPRVIIAKLHYDGDAVDILRRARENGPLMYNGKKISIFPDYTAAVAKARAAFTDVRKALQGRRDVRFGLFYPAKLRITHKSVSKDFQDPKKAMDFVQDTILSSPAEDNT